MAAPSQTLMCNGALVHLGESSRIGAIDEGTPLANVFLTIWDATRDEVLADHPWNFALFRDDLPVSADYEPAGSQYEFAYELPADCIRWLPPRRGHPDYFAGEQEGNFILSNAEAPISIRYIRQVVEVGRWSVGFRTAMTAKLAMKAAKPITGQTAMMDRMAALYDDVELPKGKRQDGLASGDRDRSAQFQSDWLDARRSQSGF